MLYKRYIKIYKKIWIFWHDPGDGRKDGGRKVRYEYFDMTPAKEERMGVGRWRRSQGRSVRKRLGTCEPLQPKKVPPPPPRKFHIAISPLRRLAKKLKSYCVYRLFLFFPRSLYSFKTILPLRLFFFLLIRSALTNLNKQFVTVLL
jgi:hypothetical protein